MGSYLDSPLYRQMLAQTLSMNQQGPQYPGQALANMAAQLVGAYNLKKFGQKLDERDTAKNNALADALMDKPVDSIAVTPALGMDDSYAKRQASGAYDQPTSRAPTSGEILSSLKASGNADAMSEFTPVYAKQVMENEARANQQMTPYERAQIVRQNRLDDPVYKRQAAEAERPSAEYAGQIAQAQAGATLPYDIQKLGAQQQFTHQENQLNRENAIRAAEARAGSTGSNVQSVIPNGDGTMTVVYRNGSTERLTLDGQVVKGARNDPTALFNQRAAGSAGEQAGKAAEAQPVVDSNFNLIMETLNSFDAPEVKAQAGKSIGFGSVLPTVPGINSDFRARAEQLQGQAFLQAYNTLKGGGQITEIEGAKATAAIARLNKAQTPDEFYRALNDAKRTFGEIYQSARTRAARGAVIPQMQGASPSPVGPQIRRYNPQTGRIE